MDNKKYNQDDSGSLVLEPILEREQSLAGSFDDAAVLQEISDSANPSIVQEAADAVQELVLEMGPDTQSFQMEPVTNSGFIVQETGDSTAVLAKCEMLEHLFSLVLSDHKFNDLTEEILKILMRSVDAQAASLLELDQERKEFFFRASVGGGDSEKLKAFRVPVGGGIVGHVAESRQPLLLQDMDDEQMQLQSISISTGLTAKSCLAVPLIIANQIYGVIELFNKSGVDYFGERDLRAMEEAVQFVAKVLEVRFFAAEVTQRRKT